MPELPEVESARAVIERFALRRRIVDVDDHDRYVCRPHPPGELRNALVGRCLVTVDRRGKSMWCTTSPGDESSEEGPTLGLHLGMSGKIILVGSDGTERDGGDYWRRGRAAGDFRFTRFALSFEDGGRLVLVDPRRLGRVRLDPPTERLGPDAALITARELRGVLERGTAPIKARLLDQEAIAGIGNLLADEILWLARIHPARPVDSLDPSEVVAIGRAIRRAVKVALKKGGVHELTIVPYRRAGARCPRDGAPMVHDTVGGRTSWWCEVEQKK